MQLSLTLMSQEGEIYILIGSRGLKSNYLGEKPNSLLHGGVSLYTGIAHYTNGKCQ